MLTHTLSLSQLGWRPFYSQQLTLEDLDAGFPARVAVVQRSHPTVLAECGERQVTLPQRLRQPGTEPAITVGDWVLVEHETLQVLRLLGRQSLIARMAAGMESRRQSIAANVDTLFVVTSCNDDFNLSRLERYLAVAFEAQVMPVIVLTKADTCADAGTFVEKARSVAGSVAVIALDATDAPRSLATLKPWLDEGQTIAFVGSSGVGKSTLINSLLGNHAQATAAIRDADSKGRHTTTARSLLLTPGGVWLIDTPGMRELKIGAIPSGLSRTFVDVEELAAHCRFRDCSHQRDEGCALRAAVEERRLEPRRLVSYLKLQREATRASLSVWQRHEQEQRFGRFVRAVQRKRRKETGRE